MGSVTVNGERKEFTDGESILRLLEELKVKPEVVAVELNGDLLRREEYETRILNEGDVVEYLYYMAGGNCAAELGEGRIGKQMVDERAEGELVTKRVRFSFPLTKVKDPVIYRLVKEFDLIPNIRRANIEAERGWVVLEISGSAENLRRGLDFVRSYGVDVEPVEGDIVEG